MHTIKKRKSPIDTKNNTHKFKCGTIEKLYCNNPSLLLHDLTTLASRKKAMVIYGNNDIIDLSNLSLGNTVYVIHIKRKKKGYVGILNFYKKVE